MLAKPDPLPNRPALSATYSHPQPENTPPPDRRHATLRSVSSWLIRCGIPTTIRPNHRAANPPKLASSKNASDTIQMTYWLRSHRKHSPGPLWNFSRASAAIPAGRVKSPPKRRLVYAIAPAQAAPSAYRVTGNASESGQGPPARRRGASASRNLLACSRSFAPVQSAAACERPSPGSIPAQPKSSSLGSRLTTASDIMAPVCLDSRYSN